MSKPAGATKFFRLAILTGFCVGPIIAYSAAAPDVTLATPPGRVARLDFFSGNVTLLPAGATTWSHAELNWPLTTGDQLWTGTTGRAELQIGSSTLRLNRKTAFDIVDLDDRTVQVKVTQGSLTTRLRTLSLGQDVEIDTPNLALQATQAGSYRVDVAPNGDATTVTLRSGTATLYGDHASLAMLAGQQIRFVGTHLQQFTGTTEPMLDGFDAWGAQRDASLNSTISAQYVSPDMTGYQDLDANGSWQTTQDYGAVWIPTVAVYSGWVPYREGHWAWIAPWGWTWIDAEPWGFAPFHYGRWAQIGGVWGWVPGPYARIWSPIYAPALVGFIGGGAMSWGINMPFGGIMSPGVAWLPLGPGENWYPAYGVSRNYFNRINNINVNTIRNTTIVNNTTIINNRNNRNYYRNSHIPGAITAIPARNFVRGMPVAAAAIPLSAQQIAHASIIGSAPTLAPVKDSFLGGMRPANTGEPRRLIQTPVIATRGPVVPPAYRDTLAQRFAAHGGLIPGVGKPVVHEIPGTKSAAGTRIHSANAFMPQTFRVIDRRASQGYDARSWEAGRHTASPLNGGIATVHSFPGSNDPGPRQNRNAATYREQKAAGGIHDFQVLHRPPEAAPATSIRSDRRAMAITNGNVSTQHPYGYPQRNQDVVRVPVEQQHRYMQEGNYRQPSYYGNERMNSQRLPSQTMPAPARSPQPAAVPYLRPAPAPASRAPVYPRAQSPQHD